MKQKTSKAKPRPSTLSNSLIVKAGPTGMQKVLKQDLHKFVIHVNKSRPAAKDHSQSTANEGCKICLTFSSSTISTICLRQHQQQCTSFSQLLRIVALGFLTTGKKVIQQMPLHCLWKEILSQQRITH